MNSYRELKVWQIGIDVVNDIYRLSKSFPKEELFGLTNQIRRAAVSIPSNLAEGYGRHGKKEFTQFAQIAFGSLVETETQMVIANNLGYVPRQDFDLVMDKLNHLGRMLSKLIASLRAPRTV